MGVSADTDNRPLNDQGHIGQHAGRYLKRDYLQSLNQTVQRELRILSTRDCPDRIYSRVVHQMKLDYRGQSFRI